MADVPKVGRIVPIIAPPHHDFADGSLISDIKHEKQQPEELPQDPRAQESRNTRSKLDTECLELPCLSQLGLYALPTEGDGNCLYYALSDQLYGDFTHADHIRTQLADHISANREYFMSFIAAAGGERRAPRRAAAEAARNSYCSSSSASPAPPPSTKDKERNFDSRVAESRKNGVWGGAEEIQAFCQSFKKDVNVYTVYGIQSFRDVHAPRDEERETLHIAFHDFHHYSSVRHSDGPHTGLPCIPKLDKAIQASNASSDATVLNMASPWKISVIQEGLGGKYDRETIVGVLEQCRGNIDNAFMNLLGDDTNTPPIEATASRAIMKSRFQPSSRSSSPFSTGSKRSADDSDEDENPRPASRRVRAREQKRRILPDVTVGIAFRDEQNDLVSLRLRVSPDKGAPQAPAEKGKGQADSTPSEAQGDSSVLPRKGRRLKSRSKQTGTPCETSSQQSESNTTERKPRRSQRLSRSRNGSQAL
ncbi:OTU domain-containing protein [Aspergillus lucknowensis]|uniref:OTU domain-containing protein n=1 Tax=Aspergillus lucknowensis TaxID=176173 RepID=A0ABR4LD11_9EURO